MAFVLVDGRNVCVPLDRMSVAWVWVKNESGIWHREGVEQTRTIGIHKAVATESAKELSDSIDWPAAQGQPPEKTISQGNRRVEIGSRVSSNVDSEYHGGGPSASRASSQFCGMDEWQVQG